MYDEKEISAKINNLMTENNLTINNVCRDYTDSFGETKMRMPPEKYIDISRTTFHKLLKGKMPKITMDQFISICNYFEVSLSYLLGESEYKDGKRETIGKELNICDDSAKNLIELSNLPINSVFDYLLKYHNNSFSAFALDILSAIHAKYTGTETTKYFDKLMRYKVQDSLYDLIESIDGKDLEKFIFETHEERNKRKKQ